MFIMFSFFFFFFQAEDGIRDKLVTGVQTCALPISPPSAFISAFTVFPKSAKAEIKADGGGVLGSIDPQTVTFTNGVSVPEFVSFELHHHTIGIDGIKFEDITWDWKFRCCGGVEWEPLQTTHHRIYIVLEEPKLPWKQQGFPNDQNPWTEALDYSCVWAAGKK